MTDKPAIPDRLRAHSLLCRALAQIDPQQSLEAAELAQDIRDALYLADPKGNLLVMLQGTESIVYESPFRRGARP